MNNTFICRFCQLDRENNLSAGFETCLYCVIKLEGENKTKLEALKMGVLIEIEGADPEYFIDFDTENDFGEGCIGRLITYDKSIKSVTERIITRFSQIKVLN